MFAKGPIKKIKAEETVASTDSDSDSEITPRVKKGTIQSFFSQVDKSSGTTERGETRLETNNDLDVEEGKNNKKSIASFFKSKAGELSDDTHKTDYLEENRTQDSKTNRLSNRITSDICKKNKCKIDFFLTPKWNEACYGDTKISTKYDSSKGESADCNPGILNFCIIDSESSNSCSNCEQEGQERLPVQADILDKHKNDFAKHLSDPVGGKQSSDEDSQVYGLPESDIIEIDIPDIENNSNNHVHAKIAEPMTHISESYVSIKEKVIDSDSREGFAPEDYLPCEKCRKPIAVWDMPEHMDFHFAMDLQKDINTVTPQVNNSSTGKRKSVGSDNRTSKKSKTSSTQGKLDAFFSKKL